MSITEIVKNNTATLERVRHNIAYYRIVEMGMVFPVPLEDVGDATLHKEEKAIMLMRYIRKAIVDGTLLKG